MSYTLKANRSFFSLLPLDEKADRPDTNSWKSTSPPPSSSKMAIMRVASGFEETWGRERNSSRSMVPELSWLTCQHEANSRHGKGRRKAYFVELHESLAQPVDLLAVNCGAGVSTSTREG